MLPLAQGLEAAGFIVYALDMRGHGESGRKGQIAQIGQLEDDLEDFIHAVRPAGPRLLVGFSAGGGFALRFAADARRRMFDAYLLLAPFLSQNASTYRPASGGWASVGLPRIFGLVVLNRLGFTGLNHLPVTAYSLAPEAEALLTPRYAYALAMNFRPHNDYQADIARANVPMEVLVGDSDDQFHADRFAAEFSAASPKVAVTIVPGVGHVGLTLGPSAIDATVQAATRLSPGVVPLRLS
jgi:alpha-beta hydrolase superfamily lysophospholipase